MCYGTSGFKLKYVTELCEMIADITFILMTINTDIVHYNNVRIFPSCFVGTFFQFREKFFNLTSLRWTVNSKYSLFLLEIARSIQITSIDDTSRSDKCFVIKTFLVKTIRPPPC